VGGISYPSFTINAATGLATFNNVVVRGLTVYGSDGVTPILLSGSSLSSQVQYSGISGTKPPTNADNTASNTAAGIAGQGDFATLDQITAANASTYIANLAVNSLQIAGNAVTVNYSATLATASSISINSYNSATYSLEFSGAYTVMESSVFNNVGQGVLAIANGGVMLDNFTAKPYLNLHLYVVPTNSSGTPTSAGSCYPSASLTVVWDAATLLSIAQYVIQASVVPPSGYFKIVLGASQWAGPVAGTPTVYFEGITGAGSAFNPSTTLSVIGTKK
jgi:hypothetical protein